MLQCSEKPNTVLQHVMFRIKPSFYDRKLLVNVMGTGVKVTTLNFTIDLLTH